MARLVRKLPALGALAVVLAIAGCGGGDDGAASPLDNALGYLPEDAPLVVTVDTDLEGEQFKSVADIVKKFPIAGRIEESIKKGLSRGSFDFDRDIKPLLGNELVVGATDPRAIVGGSDDNAFVAAIQASDEGKLQDLIEREKPRELGEKGDAKLYQGSDGDPYAVADDVLIAASSRERLEQALDQRDAGGKLTEEAFDKGLDGLPEDALVRVYGDVQKLLASAPGTREARRIEWVGALRKLGLTASARKDEIEIDLRVTTDDDDLTEADLPLAAGAASPAVVQRPGEIGVGVRGLDRLLKFVETAVQAVDPSGFGDYATGKQAIEKRLNLDIEKDFLGQLSEGVSVSISLDGKFGVRGEPKDPAEFRRTVEKVGEALPSLLPGASAGGLTKPKGGEGLYAIRVGDTRLFFGVVGDAFVLANDAERARQLATATAEPVPGAKGAVALSADAEKLATQFLRGRLSGIEALGSVFAVAPLGDLTGSLRVETDALTGSFRLTFD